jgi:NAD-dependent dihydropyrimidine dehydrogenase PreA subunit
MAYVITDACISVKDQSCVQECPVDCIHSSEDQPQYYIDPDICIDCGACQPVCPVNAIYPADEVPPDQQAQIENNAAYFQNKAKQGA